MADPGEGPEEPTPPLFLDQTKARRAEKKIGGPGPPYLRIWMTAPSLPPSYLKVCIRHCFLSIHQTPVVKM